MKKHFALSQATYIWIDGSEPTQMLRSKCRVIKHPSGKMTLDQFPIWGFDGSSTYQAEGSYSDLILQPVSFVNNPLLAEGNYLVLCEVLNPDGQPHPSNTRAKLRAVLDNGGNEHDVWFGFEQEYTLFKGQTPLGWPDRGYPAPQGPFYCGVGADEVFGRPLVEEHTQACIDSLMIFGTNAEVMPGQWEFQIGYREIETETADALTVCDHVWFARWLLYRIGEKYDISVRLHPKPVKGDWNGAGMHTNFSTKTMRHPKTGKDTIDKAIEALSKRHQTHIDVYGFGLEERLTGQYETADIKTFTHGFSDRGASIRIPQSVASKGYGYIEDRRPGANANPYDVARLLIETICGINVE